MIAVFQSSLLLSINGSSTAPIVLLVVIIIIIIILVIIIMMIIVVIMVITTIMTTGIIPGMPGLSSYGATKHAVEALTNCLRLELDAFGIKVR